MNRLLGKTLAELTDIALSVGLPKFAGKQLAEWIYLRRATTFMEMTNISAKGRQALADKYTIGRQLPVKEAVSIDGTKKYLYQVPKFHSSIVSESNSSIAESSNGLRNLGTAKAQELLNSFIETVYIPEADRATLCVSTQVGCKMGCKFCMTGGLGFRGHLTAADILNQIFSIPDSAKLTNLVYMGEGEPCDNLDAVLRSIECLTAPWGCGWSPHRITVSSVGYLPHLQQLIEGGDYHIAISLHNPFPLERAELMPQEKHSHIENVLALLKHYDFSHQRRLSFEYICFANNVSLRHANQLRRILKDLDCRVNLIRFHADPDIPKLGNPETSIPLEPSRHLSIPLVGAKDEQLVWLRDYLTNAGITTTIRKSRGEDILAACGMLAAREGKHFKDA